MKLTYFILAINLTHGAIAKTVLYTTTDLPPNSAKDDFEVVYLDSPDRISNLLVIDENSLSTSENILRNKSREFSIIHQRKIVNAWNSVITAWELGVKKYLP
ncbi:DUF1525 domain-containing protein [Rouxiella badensis]|uniref:DUF1525 domain-containing protein n=1 Tax=Rouxiella badensis TaxID=1646377 RepID=UPI0022AA1ED2|nr:DUF1525 domain-containing protein [Rouxiella badensis]WAT08793.1 DUF1525 domain-containing protein [Rouxiella badensis]